MGLFDLFKRKGNDVAEATATTPEECIHGVRVPHWDSLADMGHDERASYFVCESCGHQFTPAESAALHPASETLTGQ